MTDKDLAIIKRINSYAEEALKDIDPQKTRTGFQLSQLTPILKDIANEEGISLEDMFIKYMDLQTEFMASQEKQFQDDIKDIGSFDPVANKFNF